MDRRRFIKNAVTAAAALKLETGAAGFAEIRRQAPSLENDQLLWKFKRGPQGFASSEVRNKLSGKSYAITAATELRLIFSAAKARIEIPSWRCKFGPDNDSSPPAEESGLRAGYHRTGLDDSGWGACSNICLYDRVCPKDLPQNEGRPAVVYRGYGWFRARFTLPSEARGEEIFLNLGGYDQCDWNNYWVYINDMEVGQRTTQGRWRTPGQFRLSPNSPAYESLHFGAPNVLAVRTHEYDRHFDNLSDDILERLWFDPILYDQFVTVGAPYLEVTEFEVKGMREEQAQSGPALVVELANQAAGIGAIVHYELDGPIRRKSAEIRNDSSERKLLLDVEMDSFQIEGRSLYGGYGYPLTVDDQLFCAIEHPSGLNRGLGQGISLMHFPGKWLEPGAVLKTSSSIIGVSPAQGAHQGFLDYMNAHTLRKKKILSLYDALGTTAFEKGMNWSLNDDQNLGLLDLMAEFQKKGIKFDYYIPELSLDTTESSDLKRYRLFSFPDGPGEVVDRVYQLGMKFGQWFSITGGADSSGRNPKTIPSRMPSACYPWPEERPHPVFRHGYLEGGVGLLCVASEPYFSMLKEAILYHIRENRMRLVKLDMCLFFCNSTEHQHLPGKYSTEESLNRMIAIAKAGREVNPDLFVDFYSVDSPFFGLHGDAIFHTRLALEAACTSDCPAMFFRDSVTQTMDRGAQFAKWVLPINHESLGVWLADIEWGARMGTERWQEALVMDLGRGSLLFPQLWSDLYNLEEHDLEFLARMQALAKRNEGIFLTRRHLVGDAWKDDIYGYSYFEGEHGFVFLNNVSFDCRSVKLGLDESLGLRSPGGRTLRLLLHHPSAAMLTQNGNPDFLTAETVEIQLRPLEVMMIEVLPGAAADTSLPPREVIETSPIYSYRGALRVLAGRPDLEVHFADAHELAAKGLAKRVTSFESTLPPYSGGRHHLAVACTFKKNGRWWRQNQMSLFVQAIASAEDLVIEFTRTPDYRQNGNYEWSPWIVFSAPLPRRFTGKRVQIGITSYLPQDVEMTTDMWVIKQWWRSRRRALPNYWV